MVQLQLTSWGWHKSKVHGVPRLETKNRQRLCFFSVLFTFLWVALLARLISFWIFFHKYKNKTTTMTSRILLANIQIFTNISEKSRLINENSPLSAFMSWIGQFQKDTLNVLTPSILECDLNMRSYWSTMDSNSMWHRYLYKERGESQREDGHVNTQSYKDTYQREGKYRSSTP